MPLKLPELVAFYESKTQPILRRYGPGPRVHYHVGLVEDEYSADAGPERLRELLVRSQESMLEYAAGVWNLDSLREREILDVGCGLGGTALFLAQEYGARVTALTIAPSHVGLVRRFAAQAGVEELVAPILGDALEIPGAARFDAAIAIDSSSSFARAPWFYHLAQLLRPHGRVLIGDCFLADRDYEVPFNLHWCAQIGTLDEYLEAARDAGFHLDTIVDLSDKVRRFWSLSLSLIGFEETSLKLDEESSERLKASRRIHTMVCDGLAGGGLRQLLLGFSATG